MLFGVEVGGRVFVHAHADDEFFGARFVAFSCSPLHSDFVRRRITGFDERFVRIWTFYIAYCEAAFDTGNTDVVQFTLRRPLP